ncbi:cysteine hydrolase family protein [Streptococcus sp. ST16]|uniref:cysteine hydrolase family protein n=1 Tax=Streptococcus sp. ST16 TaxID=3378283 RepID=UPI0038D4FCA4
MTKALISIDYTEDFVADQGKLTAGAPAQAISEAIAQVTRLAFERGEYIFFTIDAHEEKDAFHPESKLFPPHNIIGTSGRNLYGKLADFYQAHASDSRVFWMDKRHYSAFSGTDLDIRLRERRVDTVILTGVLTDICVLHTAIDAYNLGYHIEIVKPAVASIWPEHHQFALGHFKNTLGAKLLDENLAEIQE